MTTSISSENLLHLSSYLINDKENKAKFLFSCFFKAIEEENLAMIEKCIILGADPTSNSASALIFTAKKGNLKILSYLLSVSEYFSSHIDSILDESFLHGHLHIIEYLHEQGFNIRYDNEIALKISAEHGHLSLVQYLLDNGADIHTSNDYPLIWSAVNGHFETVKYLISKGADLNTDSSYALRYSVKKGHIGIVNILIDNGANVFAHNHYVLNYASKNGNLALVKYLYQFYSLPEEQSIAQNIIQESKQVHIQVWLKEYLIEMFKNELEVTLPLSQLNESQKSKL